MECETLNPLLASAQAPAALQPDEGMADEANFSAEDGAAWSKSYSPGSAT